MTADDSLARRIEAEFTAREQRLKSESESKLRELKDLEQRLERFNVVCDELREIWQPRIEAFAERFGEQIKVTPVISPTAREMKAAFMTDLANITLTLSASASTDAKKLALDYDLLIVPKFFEYERHVRYETPMDKIDRDAIAKWIEDRLVSCVKAYLSVQDNEHYLKRSMIEDPISKTRFLRQDAAAQIEHNGKTFFFASKETLESFKSKHGITA